VLFWRDVFKGKIFEFVFAQIIFLVLSFFIIFDFVVINFEALLLTVFDKEINRYSNTNLIAKDVSCFTSSPLAACSCIAF